MKWWRDGERDLVSATKDYVRWCRIYCDFDKALLPAKHEEMAAHRFAFLRGSFYRWGWMLATAGDIVWKAPKILAVGDIHAENFGTWRDDEGRLVFGVNDFDEAAKLPFTADLVRLALSARLIADEEGTDEGFGGDAAVDAVLDGYCGQLGKAPWPQVLEDRNEDLRDTVLKSEKDVEKFWRKLDEDPVEADEIPGQALALLQDGLPRHSENLQYRFRGKRGLGSRGRPRFAVVADWHGGKIAREVKAAVPSAVLALDEDIAEPTRRMADILKTRRLCADPKLQVTSRWTLRRLSPETRKLEWEDLKKGKHWASVMTGMGAALASIHLAQKGGEDIADAAGADGFGRALRKAVGLAGERLEEDWKAFEAAREEGILR